MMLRAGRLNGALVLAGCLVIGAALLEGQEATVRSDRPKLLVEFRLQETFVPTHYDIEEREDIESRVTEEILSAFSCIFPFLDPVSVSGDQGAHRLRMEFGCPYPDATSCQTWELVYKFELFDPHDGPLNSTGDTMLSPSKGRPSPSLGSMPETFADTARSNLVATLQEEQGQVLKDVLDKIPLVNEAILRRKEQGDSGWYLLLPLSPDILTRDHQLFPPIDLLKTIFRVEVTPPTDGGEHFECYSAYLGTVSSNEEIPAHFLGGFQTWVDPDPNKQGPICLVGLKSFKLLEGSMSGPTPAAVSLVDLGETSCPYLPPKAGGQ